jgi:hypothetical protein
LAPDPQAAALSEPAQCTAVGFHGVELIAWAREGVGSEAPASQRIHPCFPRGFSDPGAAVAGPTLDPGTYEIVARGVKGDGQGWLDSLLDVDSNDAVPHCLDPGRCEAGFLACDCDVISVREGETLRLTEFVLAAPSECDDGVDNDRDGLVDHFDPACEIGDLEGGDASVAQLEVVVSFLGQNVHATCNDVGISRLLIDIDSQHPRDFPCTTNAIAFTETLASGPHTLTVTGARASGGAVTETRSMEFAIADGGGGFFEFPVDFGQETFLEPIEASLRILPRFEPFVGAPFDRACEPIPDFFGTLRLTDVSIAVLDSRGNPLSRPLQARTGEPLDGTVIACPNIILATDPVVWNGFLAEVEAMSETGEVCFSNVGTPEPLVPGENPIIVPRRLLDSDDDGVGDTPPAGCEDCQSDADCPEGVCEQGICRF